MTPWREKRRSAVVLAATLAAVTAAAGLGSWQLRRAEQKIALQWTLESRARMPALGAADLAADPARASSQRYRAIRLRGHWIDDRSVFLENRQMSARVGFYLVTPLQLDGSANAVLVQRGWVPRDLRERTLVPAVPTASGTVEIQGRVAPPPGRLYEFSTEASGPIRQNLDVAAFAAESGLRLLPLSVEQADSAATVGDGLLRHWPLPAVDVQKHHGYAFQWFALGALMTGLYVWFQLLRPWRARRG